MTRIVGGSAKGHRLAVPVRVTRPTSDRAREALFNSLRALLDITGAQVLDLFAGSGAVGLEALSRGAAQAVFVESDRRACDVLRRNIAATGLAGAFPLCRPVGGALASPHAAAPFDLVFADPPYALGDTELAGVLAQLGSGWLADGAVVVIERSARAAEPAWPDGVVPVMNRRYGEAMLWYGRAR